MAKKIIFLDRDGTLIDEPMDQQIDSIAKLYLKKNVIPALLTLKKAGYCFVMITNQDGIGTTSFPQDAFDGPQNLLLHIFNSQGIQFEDVLICPHLANDDCFCRKPKVGLVMKLLKSNQINFDQSYMIGDRETDIEFANNLSIKSILYDNDKDWLDIAASIISQPRAAKVQRTTTETDIHVEVNLDQCNDIKVHTGLGFFDHMLMQLAKHGGFNLKLQVKGDLEIDEHHTVEDTALALGKAIRKALSDKLGIHRYGFVLPMDEALTTTAIDLSGRSYFVFEGQFAREKVGEFPTELVSHFFRSFAESLGAAIHIKVHGENTHHMIESIFKCVGRALRQAVYKQGDDLPSTKGVL